MTQFSPTRWLCLILLLSVGLAFACAPIATANAPSHEASDKEAADDGPPVTEGEIEYMIELGKKEGVFEEKGRGQLLQSALEFSDTIAKEVMIPRTEAHFLQVDTPLDEALARVIEWGHSRIPVYVANRDEVLGVLYANSNMLDFGVRVGARDLSSFTESLLLSTFLSVRI